MGCKIIMKGLVSGESSRVLACSLCHNNPFEEEGEELSDFSSVESYPAFGGPELRYKGPQRLKSAAVRLCLAISSISALI